MSRKRLNNADIRRSARKKRQKTSEPSPEAVATPVPASMLPIEALPDPHVSSIAPLLSQPESTSNVERPSSKRQRQSRTITTMLPGQQADNEKLFIQRRCLTERQKRGHDFPMCNACSVRRVTAGNCKFATLRAFPYINGDNDNNINTTTPIFIDQRPMFRLKREADRVPQITSSTHGEDKDIEFMKSCITDTLLAALEADTLFEASVKDKLVRRRREARTRSICDGCATSIFFGHFMCCSCGKELCLDCYSDWCDSQEIGFENLDICGKARRHTKVHFVPFTFFKPDERETMMEKVKGFQKKIVLLPQPNALPMKTTVESLPYAKPHVDHISEDEFQVWWGMRQPLVVTGCLERFSLPWTPEYFIEHYGAEICHLFNCETDEVITSTVGKFFEGFNSTEPQKPLKLKDWPPADDFARTFPELFNDFENALPFPRYTRRKGFLNLVSRFPEDLVVPDLGPKMYNAYASGVQGTTKLHLDMTDAVNIMVYASESAMATAYGGAAVWDIFPADATDKLNQFLRETVATKAKYSDNPILRQQFYLTTPQLANLARRYNVSPWRIYQNPGDAVFIPTGCAHQVRNLTSCIKIACDFVSPHCIPKCFDLIGANRRLAAKRGGKKEDVLQLKTMMMCAWEEMDRWQEKERTGDTEMPLIEGPVPNAMITPVAWIRTVPTG